MFLFGYVLMKWENYSSSINIIDFCRLLFESFGFSLDYFWFRWFLLFRWLAPYEHYLRRCLDCCLGAWLIILLELCHVPLLTVLLQVVLLYPLNFNYILLFLYIHNSLVKLFACWFAFLGCRLLSIPFSSAHMGTISSISLRICTSRSFLVLCIFPFRMPVLLLVNFDFLVNIGFA